MQRTLTYQYSDPLALLWITTAQRIGLTLERTEDAYASTDGHGKLSIASDEHLDPDDSLGQMIFHEICHSLIEGESSFEKADWGLDNTGNSHVPNEIACIRLQAALTLPLGLAEFFAPTTDFRMQYREIVKNPLFPRTDPTVILAIKGLQRSRQLPWGPHLERALEQTSAIGSALATFVDNEKSLWNTVDSPKTAHPLLFPAYVGPDTVEEMKPSCETCAWSYVGGRGKAVSRCRQAEDSLLPSRLPPKAPACIRWEPKPKCRDCGACCREAYHSVTVSTRDPVRKHHPELVVDRGSYLEILRDGDHCAALTREDMHFTCSIYENRPTCCRDLENSSAHCLTARKRIGLSP